MASEVGATPGTIAVLRVRRARALSLILECVKEQPGQGKLGLQVLVAATACCVVEVACSTAYVKNLEKDVAKDGGVVVNDVVDGEGGTDELLPFPFSVASSASHSALRLRMTPSTGG